MRHYVILAFLILLGGCGQTGPLYLPGSAPGQGPDEAAAVTPEDTAP